MKVDVGEVHDDLKMEEEESGKEKIKNEEEAETAKGSDMGKQ